MSDSNSTIIKSEGLITAKDAERAMAQGRWSVVACVNTPACEATQNAATFYFESEDEAIAYLAELGGYDAQTTPSDWKRARERTQQAKAR